MRKLQDTETTTHYSDSNHTFKYLIKVIKEKKLPNISLPIHCKFYVATVSGNTLILVKEICSHLVHLEEMNHRYLFSTRQGQFAFSLCARVGTLCFVRSEATSEKCNYETISSGITK